MEEKTTMPVLPETDAKTYRKVFGDNYRGASPEGRELKDFLQKRDSGKAKVDYIPWAVLVRMAKMQDPDFELEKVRNTDGTFLFYNGREGMDDACYFVKVKANFLGKTMVEEYPVQDFNFEAVSFNGRIMTLASGRTKEIKMDANIVNKALQRATAKVISAVTGLGLSLYENGDLQFEEDTPVTAGVSASVSTPAPSLKPRAKTPVAPTPVAEKAKVEDIDSDVAIDTELTPEVIKQLKEFAANPATKARFEKAMSAYGVTEIAKFKKEQADRIIEVLKKTLEGENK